MRTQPKTEDAADLILANAIDFLNAGLSLLFSKGATSRKAKVAIVSIQTAIELLAKYRLVKERGLAAIVRGDIPTGSLDQAARIGAPAYEVTPSPALPAHDLFKSLVG
jgi:hypothetical protein